MSMELGVGKMWWGEGKMREKCGGIRGKEGKWNGTRGVHNHVSEVRNCCSVVNRKSETMPPPKEITYKSVHNGYYRRFTPIEIYTLFVIWNVILNCTWLNHEYYIIQQREILQYDKK